MLFTRREAGKVLLAAMPTARVLQAGTLHSTFAGVQVGAITYSFGSMKLDDVIQAYADIGLEEMELMSETAEAAAGLPAAPPRGGGGPGGRSEAEGGRASVPSAAEPRTQAAGVAPGPPPARAARPPMTGEQIAAARAQPRAQEILKWRKSVSMDRFKEIRGKANQAGIQIAVLCFNMNVAVTNDEMDYAFNVARALGAGAISTSTQVTVAKRVAPFAEKHRMRIGFHGHDNNADPNETGSLESYAQVLSYGKYNAVNLDIGHFTACNYDALAFIQEHHARITNLHLKDRRKDHGPNVPWGQGDTPIKAVLELLRRERYRIPANIELEYPVPAGSDRVAEVKKCLAYCKAALA